MSASIFKAKRLLFWSCDARGVHVSLHKQKTTGHLGDVGVDERLYGEELEGLDSHQLQMLGHVTCAPFSHNRHWASSCVHDIWIKHIKYIYVNDLY